MTRIGSAAPPQRTSTQPSRTSTPSRHGLAAAPVQCKALPPEESVQRLARALPTRPETPARWSGPVVQGAGMEEAIPDSKVHQAAKLGTSGGGGSLPYLDKIQRAFGKHDVSHVVAHTDWAAKKGSEAMGARAFTTGNHVAFAGTPTLHTAAHEAAHVVQQQKGVQLKGGVGRVGDPYERHADAVADAVVSGRSAEALLAPFARGGSGGGGAVQRDVDIDDEKYSDHPDVGTERLTQNWGFGPTETAQTRTQYTPQQLQIIRRNSYTLNRPTKFYRWGEYSVEKHFVAANGFSLNTCNQGGKDYGRGLYLADTPFSSAQYNKDQDGACLEVTVPRGVRILRMHNAAVEPMKKDLYQAIREPTMMEVSEAKWYVLKDDQLPGLSIKFYKPTDDHIQSAAFLKMASAKNGGGDLFGHRAVKTIHRQMGKPIRTPPNLDSLLSVSGGKAQRLRRYIAAMNRLDYVPFEFAQGRDNFSEEYANFKESITGTNRYNLYFTKEIDTALTAWAADPFSYTVDQFVDGVLEPYFQATKGYLGDRKQNMYEWRRNQSGTKERAVVAFKNRLVSFWKLLKFDPRLHGDENNGLNLGGGLAYEGKDKKK